MMESKPIKGYFDKKEGIFIEVHDNTKPKGLDRYFPEMSRGHSEMSRDMKPKN